MKNNIQKIMGLILLGVGLSLGCKTPNEKKLTPQILNIQNPSTDKNASPLRSVVDIDLQQQEIDLKLKDKNISDEEKVQLELLKTELQKEKEILLLENKKINQIEQRKESEKIRSINADQ